MNSKNIETVEMNFLVKITTITPGDRNRNEVKRKMTCD